MPSFQHLLALNTIFNILRALLAPRSFVAGDVAILTNPRNHREHLMPDVFVVLDAGELDPVYHVLRRQYRLWDEARVPDIVIEAASRTTVGRDTVGKKDDYAGMGVREYVQFDPIGDFLDPRLRVFVLGDDGTYHPVAPEADGSVRGAVLPYDWVREDDSLRLRDRATGRLVPTAEELSQTEAARADAEATRAEAAEAELARVRAELARLQDAGPSSETAPA
jgi:hypothetical protein